MKPVSGAAGEIPTFLLQTSEPGAIITCSVDGGSWIACASPYTPPNLGVGNHTLDVHFTDAAGNVNLQSANFNVAGESTTPPAKKCINTTSKLTTNVTISSAGKYRKSRLVVTVTNDQFIIVQLNLKSKGKRLAQQTLPLSAGTHRIPMVVRKMPRKKKLTLSLDVLSRSGVVHVTNGTLTVAKTGKVSIAGSIGTVAEDCNQPGADFAAIVVTPKKGKLKAGAKKFAVSTTSTQYALATISATQRGKKLALKTVTLTPGKTLKAVLKLAKVRRLVKGKLKLKVSTVSADGVRMTLTKTVSVR
jgi:hypothetical protein